MQTLKEVGNMIQQTIKLKATMEILIYNYSKWSDIKLFETHGLL